MNWKGTVVLLALIVLAVLMSTGCGYHYTCKVTFGGPPCSTGGSGTGTFGSGGGNGNGAGASDYFYTLASGGVQGNFFFEGSVLNNSGWGPLTGTALPQVPYGSYPDMAIVSKTFLYAPDTPLSNGAPSGPGEVHAFSVSHIDGGLVAVTGSPFTTTQTSADTMAFDNGGKFLFIGDVNGGTIAAFLIDSSTGGLTAAPGSPFSVPGSPQAMAVDASGKYLYASFATAGGVMAFNIDQSTGALSAMAGSPFDVNASANLLVITTESSGKFLVGTTNTRFTSNRDTHLYVVPINQTSGALNAAIPFPTSNVPIAVTASPTASFVYAFTLDSSNAQAPIEGFAIDASGTLSPIPGSPFSSVSGGLFGKFDQNGTELFYPQSQYNFAVAAPDATTGALTQTAPPTGVRHGNGLDEVDEFAVTN